MIVKNYIMSVLGLDSGYTVKYNPFPPRVPSGLALGNSFRQRVYLTVYPSSRPNTDTISGIYINKIIQLEFF